LLVHKPALGDDQSQHGADGGGLHDGAESLIVVQVGVLGESSEDPMSLVPVQRTIRLKLMLEDPLVSHHIGPKGP
jgi:hypothetical protein